MPAYQTLGTGQGSQFSRLFPVPESCCHLLLTCINTFIKFFFLLSLFTTKHNFNYDNTMFFLKRLCYFCLKTSLRCSNTYRSLWLNLTFSFLESSSPLYSTSPCWAFRVTSPFLFTTEACSAAILQKWQKTTFIFCDQTLKLTYFPWDSRGIPGPQKLGFCKGNHKSSN